MCLFLYIVKTLFFLFCILPRIIYIAIFLYIYLCFHQTSSFPIYIYIYFLSQTLPRLVPSAHFSYIQTTLFSLVFAQYLFYIMYYSYIYRINTYFFLLGQIFIYIVKFLCFSYILKTIENVYFLIYIRDSSFSFLFSRIFKILSICIGFAKIYGVFLYSIFPYMYCPGNMVFIYRWFSLFVFCPDLGVFSYIYRYFLIYMEYHPFCNVFPIYNNAFFFLCFAQNLCIFL